MLPALLAMGSALLEDVGVPMRQLTAPITGIEAIAADCGIVICTVAHAGDGNAHPMIVFDPTDSDTTERAHVVFSRIMALAIGVGGTITGEHGIGRLKRDWLPRQLGGDVMELNRRIKAALDPIGILNPGAALA